MKLTKKTNSDGTVTLSWEKVPGVDGFRFYSAGVFRSDTWDAHRTSVKFTAGQEPYKVEAIVATAWNVIDQGTFPETAPKPPDPPPKAVLVAPITVTQQGGSDQRVCLFTGTVEGGPTRPGVSQLPDGRYTDESGAIYQSNGLEDSSIRTKIPEGAFGLTKAREMDGRNACQCHDSGDPTKNTGSWTV